MSDEIITDLNFDNIISMENIEYNELLIYDKTNINIISHRKDIYLDFSTCPLEIDIECNNINKENNIYDINKYFIFKSYNYNNILIIYDFMTMETILLKCKYNISEYIIFNRIILIMLDNQKNLFVDLEVLKYKLISKWNNIILKSDEIALYIKHLCENNLIEKHITRNVIDMDNNSIDINRLIEHKKNKYKHNSIICIRFYNNIRITVPDINNNIIIINDNKYKLDYNILDIINLSLYHILIITHDNIPITFDIRNSDQDEYDSYLSLINKLDHDYYYKIRNSYIISE
ncbi:hypothetical protein [Alphaentomopoxvirus acuprea]|uniref:Uncharacterized protein n=1 Tax=Alphaentomopoxvirus acuprea TaxID=62099 RepID=W6JIP1_9POXV|nr:hypothetical protein BA82_gp052 [Anomala cuprea entomopoxvirus]BAO49412.1 hypothetical protein [Anomala cuprea entomopoxvirus]